MAGEEASPVRFRKKRRRRGGRRGSSGVGARSNDVAETEFVVVVVGRREGGRKGAPSVGKGQLGTGRLK